MPTAPAALLEFVQGMADGRTSEGQMAAFAMAVRCRGLSSLDTVRLTLAMRDSGERLTRAMLGIDRPLLDKHSTGGVGDAVSLALAPMLAACGAAVPMLSGRGLGHTGGTLDKLGAIPGYTIDADVRINTYYETDVRYGDVSGHFVSGMGKPHLLEPPNGTVFDQAESSTSASGFAPVPLRFLTSEPPVHLLPPYPIDGLSILNDQPATPPVTAVPSGVPTSAPGQSLPVSSSTCTCMPLSRRR